MALLRGRRAAWELLDRDESGGLSSRGNPQPSRSEQGLRAALQMGVPSWDRGPRPARTV